MWSGDHFEPVFSNPTFRLVQNILVFERPESAAFTITNGICRRAGEKRGKNVDFWRAVTFKRLRMAAF